MKKLSDQELEQQATAYRNNGQVDAAVRAYQELIARFEKAKNPQRAAEMQHMVGVTYKVGNHTNESLQALDNALERYKAVNDTVGVGRALRDKGITYQYVKRYQEAKDLLQESVMVLQGVGNAAELGISEAKIGNLLREAGVLDKAEVWINRALETLQNTGHWFYISTTLLHKADLKLARHQYADALAAAEAAEKILRDNNGEQVQKRRLAQMWFMKASIYQAMGDFEKASECKEAGQAYAAALDEASRRYLEEQVEGKDA